MSDIAVSDDGTIWVTENVYVWGSYTLPSDVMRGTADVAVAEVETVDTAEADDGIDIGDVDVPADEPVEDEYFESVIRRHLDKDGNEIESFDLSTLNEKLSSMLGEDEYINSSSFGPDGNLYVTTGTKLYVLDMQMNILYSVEGENLWNEPMQLGSGLLGFQVWNYDEETETSSQTIKTIDPEAKDWGIEYPMPQNAYSTYPGGGDYLFYYQVNDAIFGFKAGEPDENGMGTGEGERLFSWVEADINNDNVRDFFFLPDGRVAALLQEWDENYENVTVSVALLTATPGTSCRRKPRWFTPPCT